MVSKVLFAAQTAGRAVLGVCRAVTFLPSLLLGLFLLFIIGSGVYWYLGGTSGDFVGRWIKQKVLDERENVENSILNEIKALWFGNLGEELSASRENSTSQKGELSIYDRDLAAGIEYNRKMLEQKEKEEQKQASGVATQSLEMAEGDNSGVSASLRQRFAFLSQDDNDEKAHEVDQEQGDVGIKHSPEQQAKEVQKAQAAPTLGDSPTSRDTHSIASTLSSLHNQGGTAEASSSLSPNANVGLNRNQQGGGDNSQVAAQGVSAINNSIAGGSQGWGDSNATQAFNQGIEIEHGAKGEGESLAPAPSSLEPIAAAAYNHELTVAASPAELNQHVQQSWQQVEQLRSELLATVSGILGVELASIESVSGNASNQGEDINQTQSIAEITQNTQAPKPDQAQSINGSTMDKGAAESGAGLAYAAVHAHVAHDDDAPPRLSPKDYVKNSAGLQVLSVLESMYLLPEEGRVTSLYVRVEPDYDDTRGDLFGLGVKVLKNEKYLTPTAPEIMQSDSVIVTYHQAKLQSDLIKQNLCEQGVCEKDYADDPELYKKLFTQAYALWFEHYYDEKMKLLVERGAARQLDLTTHHELLTDMEPSKPQPTPQSRGVEGTLDRAGDYLQVKFSALSNGEMFNPISQIPLNEEDGVSTSGVGNVQKTEEDVAINSEAAAASAQAIPAIQQLEPNASVSLLTALTTEEPDKQDHKFSVGQELDSPATLLAETLSPKNRPELIGRESSSRQVFSTMNDYVATDKGFQIVTPPAHNSSRAQGSNVDNLKPNPELDPVMRSKQGKLKEETHSARADVYGHCVAGAKIQKGIGSQQEQGGVPPVRAELSQGQNQSNSDLKVSTASSAGSNTDVAVYTSGGGGTNRVEESAGVGGLSPSTNVSPSATNAVLGKSSSSSSEATVQEGSGGARNVDTADATHSGLELDPRYSSASTNLGGWNVRFERETTAQPAARLQPAGESVEPVEPVEPELELESFANYLSIGGSVGKGGTGGSGASVGAVGSGQAVVGGGAQGHKAAASRGQARHGSQVDLRAKQGGIMWPMARSQGMERSSIGIGGASQAQAQSPQNNVPRKNDWD